jgi:hypothetical protein
MATMEEMQARWERRDAKLREMELRYGEERERSRARLAGVIEAAGVPAEYARLAVDALAADGVVFAYMGEC